MREILLFTFINRWQKTCIGNTQKSVLRLIVPDQKHSGRLMIWYKLTLLVQTPSDSLYELTLYWRVFYLSFLISLHSWPCREKCDCVPLWASTSLCYWESQWCTSPGWILLEPSAVAAGSICQCRTFNIFIASSHCQSIWIRMAM